MRTFIIFVFTLLSHREYSALHISEVDNETGVNGTIALLPDDSKDRERSFLAPKIPSSHPSADVPMNFADKRNLYSKAFFVETLSTGFDVHLIKGDTFDMPNEEQQLIAIIVSRMWLKLPIMDRIDRILSTTSKATAELYINPVTGTDVLSYHYNYTRAEIFADPMLAKIYIDEENQIPLSKLPALSVGTIDLRNVKTILRRAQIEYLTNVKLRKLLLHLKFARRAFGKLENCTNVDDDRLLAHAIVELSTRSKIADEVQHVYDGIIEMVVQTGLRQTKRFDNHRALEKLLFRALYQAFENNLKIRGDLFEVKKILLSTQTR